MSRSSAVVAPSMAGSLPERSWAVSVNNDESEGLVSGSDQLPAPPQYGTLSQQAPPPSQKREHGSVNAGGVYTEDGEAEEHESDGHRKNSEVSETDDCESMFYFGLLVFFAIYLLASMAYTSAAISKYGIEQACGDANLSWYTIGTLIVRVVAILLLVVFMAYVVAHADEDDTDSTTTEEDADSTAEPTDCKTVVAGKLAKGLASAILIFECAAFYAVYVVATTCSDNAFLLGLVIFNAIYSAIFLLLVALFAHCYVIQHFLQMLDIMRS